MGMGLIGKTLTPERVIRLLLNMGAKRIATKSMTKFVPVIGSGISAGISYYLLRKVGNAHIEECYQLAHQLQEGDGTNDTRLHRLAIQSAQALNTWET